MLWNFIRRGEEHSQKDRLRLTVLIEFSLVNDGQQDIQDRRIRLEDFLQESQPRGRNLALFSSNVAAFAKFVDVDRTDDF